MADPLTLAAIAAPRRPLPWLALASAALLALVLGWGLAPWLFTATDPLRGVPLQALQPPSAAHWFGTDHLGRDILARTIHGSATSLQATGLAVLVALLGGAPIGLLAGFFGGRLDAVLMRAVDVLMAIPSLLLSMAIVTVLGFGTVEIAVAVGLSAVAAFARLARGEALRWRHAVFVEAGLAAGVGIPATILRHVLPHAAGPVLALAALEFGSAVLAVSSLSFLGFGAPPPQPEWGLLIAEGRNYLAVAWWYTTLPGLVVLLVVLAANQLARHAQDRGQDRGGPR
ncbi:ABC transporter permease [Roseomonas sp. 18066]|uniref:ABC transporter permease n=1 Tax=Roseomonas sp. 18066 TaxID=2681412 RepID=UPI00135A1827|nr:ABC transporter permease [Roseomonas sp. 18066]